MPGVTAKNGAGWNRLKPGRSGTPHTMPRAPERSASSSSREATGPSSIGRSKPGGGSSGSMLVSTVTAITSVPPPPSATPSTAARREQRAQLLQNLEGGARAHEGRCADLHGRGPDGDELERVTPGHDPARADHGDAHGSRCLVTARERERLDRGAREPARRAAEP